MSRPPLPGQEELLCQLLERFCDDEGLPYLSADELALALRHEAEDAPPYRQRMLCRQATWLEAYGELWDSTLFTTPDEGDDDGEQLRDGTLA